MWYPPSVPFPVEHVTPPRAIIGEPHWSHDGRYIALLAEERQLGFPFIELYSLENRAWVTQRTPFGLASQKVSWTRDDSLLVELRDRFGSSLWSLKPLQDELHKYDVGRIALGSGTNWRIGRSYS